MSEPFPLRDTPEARLRLQRILADPFFSRAAGSVELLKGLAATVFERQPPPKVEDVPVKRLNDRLTTYFVEGEGRFDPEKWSVRQRTIYCETRENWHILRGPGDPFSWYRHKSQEHGIDFDAMRDFLRTLSASDHVAAGGIDQKVKEWARTNGFHATFERPGEAIDELFRFAKSQNRPLSFTQFVHLAWDLGVHRVALDHLLSKPIGDNAPGLILRAPGPLPYAVIQDPTREDLAGFRAVEEPAIEQAKRQYWIPESRLESHVAFVYLVLAPEGHSDHHHHAGEELQFVIKGEIRTTFSDCGVECRAREGTFIHFYSEQNHIVHNDSKDDYAHVLVIRFYPSSEADTRHDVRGRLWKKLIGESADGPHSPVQLNAHERLLLLEEAASRARVYNALMTVPSDVSDRLGFVRLLEARLPPRGEGPAQREWQTFRREEHIAATEPERWLWDVATYRANVARSSLPRVARLFKVFNLLLLGFLFPSDAPTIMVRRRGRHDTLSRDWMRLADLARDTTLEIPGGGVNYDIPTRSLTYSNAGITWITLENNNATTKRNKHEGSELLVPLSGDITIRFYKNDKTDQPIRELRVSAARKELAHFRSDTWHAVVNSGTTPASIFVVRLNEPES